MPLLIRYFINLSESKMTNQPKHTTAFSLVELSIVLVILGLLTGGILAGQSLIRAAELRSVAAQYSSYSAALKSFNDKYFSIPGDMANATAFWGAADGSTGTTTPCRTTVGVGTATCNGDGNRSMSVPLWSSESYRFWQHLANAGLIEGSYTGVDVTSFASTSLNSPVGKVGNSLWYAQSWQTYNGDSTFYNGDYGNSLQIGGFTSAFWPNTPLFKPEEAWNIDTKMDDGGPGTGKLSTFRIWAGTCSTTGSTAGAGAYNLTNNSPACFLVFKRSY